MLRVVLKRYPFLFTFVRDAKLFTRVWSTESVEESKAAVNRLRIEIEDTMTFRNAHISLGLDDGWRSGALQLND
jgi:hypothetical protein